MLIPLTNPQTVVLALLVDRNHHSQPRVILLLGCSGDAAVPGDTLCCMLATLIGHWP